MASIALRFDPLQAVNESMVEGDSFYQTRVCRQLLPARQSLFLLGLTLFGPAFAMATGRNGAQKTEVGATSILPAAAKRVQEWPVCGVRLRRGTSRSNPGFLFALDLLLRDHAQIIRQNPNSR